MKDKSWPKFSDHWICAICNKDITQTEWHVKNKFHFNQHVKNLQSINTKNVKFNKYSNDLEKDIALEKSIQHHLFQ